MDAKIPFDLRCAKCHEYRHPIKCFSCVACDAVVCHGCDLEELSPIGSKFILQGSRLCRPCFGRLTQTAVNIRAMYQGVPIERWMNRQFTDAEKDQIAKRKMEVVSFQEQLQLERLEKKMSDLKVKDAPEVVEFDMDAMVEFLEEPVNGMDCDWLSEDEWDTGYDSH